MQEHSSLDQYVAACLYGTRLTPDRRRQVAEELRSHLESRIAAKRSTGLDEARSIQAALNEFGRPQSIRSGFRRRQVLLDIHDGLMETRKNLWQPLLYSGVLGSLAFAVHFRAAGMGTAVLRSFVLFILLFAVTAGFMLIFSTLSHRLHRPLLRSEYHFLPSWVRWSLAVAAGLLVVVVLAMLTGAALGEFGPPAQFCRLYLAGWGDSLAGNLLRCGLGALGFGLTIAIYERRRCIETEDACEV